MTWNIHRLAMPRQPSDAPWDPQVAMQVARRIERADIDPDIVLLQEVDYRTRRSGNRDHARVLASFTGGGDSHFVGEFRQDGGEKGHAVITRNGYEIVPGSGRGEILTEPPLSDVKRVAQIVRVRSPDGDHATVVNVHLSPSPKNSYRRQAQLARLHEIVREIQWERPGEPVIVGGDFNLQAERGYEHLRARELGLEETMTDVGVPFADGRRVTHLSGGGRGIDMLFAPQGSTLRSQVFGSWPESALLRPSDHEPMVAAIRLARRSHE